LQNLGYLTAISVLGGVGDQTSLTYCTKLKTHKKENRSKFGLITAEIPPACPPSLVSVCHDVKVLRIRVAGTAELKPAIDREQLSKFEEQSEICFGQMPKW
jgi:hypothetical protein